MKRKIVFILIILILVVFIVGTVLRFTLLKPEEDNDIGYKEEAIESIRYKKELVEKGNIKAEIFMSGTINPVILVDIGIQVSGKIAYVYVDFNSKVKEGQIIAELDQSPFLAKIKQNEANHESAMAVLEKAEVNFEITEKNYNRMLKLFEQEMISCRDKDNAEAQYKRAKVDIRSAKARVSQAESQLNLSKVELDYTIIKSPINGIIILRNINPGQIVAASFQAPVLFKIASDLTRMQVEYHIEEAYIGKIKQGQMVKFRVDAFPEKTFYAKVTQIRYAPDENQDKVTYTTIAEVKNPDMKLRPGMTVTTGEAKDVFMIPNTALEFEPLLDSEEKKKMLKDMGDGFSYVWIENDDGKIDAVLIKTGITDGNYTEVVEIIKGSLKQDQFVLTGIEKNKGGASATPFYFYGILSFSYPQAVVIKNLI